MGMSDLKKEFRETKKVLKNSSLRKPTFLQTQE